MKEIQIKVTYNQARTFHRALILNEVRVAYIQWLDDSAIFSIDVEDSDEVELIEMLKKEHNIIEII